MGKPIVHDFTQRNTILKYFPYQGAPCIVPQSMVSDADENGRKIAKAGTPFPSNDNECLGYLFDDVDVTLGDAPGTYVFEGTIDWEKVKGLSPQITAAARKATPRVTFFGAEALTVE